MASTAELQGSVLYRDNEDGIVILDIPRSLEEAQVRPGEESWFRILSSEPPAAPFDVPEPRDAASYSMYTGAGAAAAQVADLMTAAAVDAAVETLQTSYNGPFHLERLLVDVESSADAVAEIRIPPYVTYLAGTIQDKLDAFADSAPQFNLIVMDPPWPNRSVKRKQNSYDTVATITEMRQLLESIPISPHLAPNGLLAVWITNKPSILDLLTSPNGLFAYWGLELAAQWTWVKCTTTGEPLFDTQSTWRKPWETLLIAKRRGTPPPPVLRPLIIFAVPDLHSRKPNLRGLFTDALGSNYYEGLEIFARNLTSGWWSWGNEVLRFQQPECWSRVSSS
ncbi:hypothetical protein VHEMI04580 [[Torrubiella] hemipterigena]|uniref:MT-A70 family n=1 Tax=[Torrubiella] hemipterigena TaxID=1531966 RepID=A0A0A1SVQ8_9HYPO|nr:hypothetical protein VHEMI04580 [[Torrubiella] hemipterigena]